MIRTHPEDRWPGKQQHDGNPGSGAYTVYECATRRVTTSISQKEPFLKEKYRVWNKCVQLELKQNHPPNMMYLVDGWNRQENRATKTELHYRINLIQKLSRTDMTDST